MADMNDKSIKDRPDFPADTSSRLGPEVEINGEIASRENLTISGRFHGKIKIDTHDLIISTGGQIEGEIQARHILIQGTLLGNVQASGRVSIEASATVNGDIAASSVSIQEGAKFKGSVKMAAPQSGLPLR